MTTSLADRTKSALADGTVTPDGHTIFKPEFYASHFTPDELDKLTVIYKSDFSSGKSTIFDTETGEPVESLRGIYNLDFLMWLAEALGVGEYRTTFGRGSQAQVIVQAIQEFLGNE